MRRGRLETKPRHNLRFCISVESTIATGVPLYCSTSGVERRIVGLRLRLTRPTNARKEISFSPKSQNPYPCERREKTLDPRFLLLSSLRTRGCGFTFEVQQVVSKNLGGCLIVGDGRAAFQQAGVGSQDPDNYRPPNGPGYGDRPPPAAPPAGGAERNAGLRPL